MGTDTAFDILNPDGRFPLVLTCEHASCSVPARYQNLGLSEAALRRHIGWDIGARAVLETVVRTLDAPAVCSGYSRLLIDCNRELHAHDLIVTHSDGTPIPGNQGLSEAERHTRITQFYQPYHDAIDTTLGRLLARRTAVRPALLSLHSFTPALRGQAEHERAFDIGILFDRYQDLAADFGHRLHRAGYRVRHNEPYSGYEGLIFSAHSHGRRHRLVYLELEMNNSLLIQSDSIGRMAEAISGACVALSKWTMISS